MSPASDQTSHGVSSKWYAFEIFLGNNEVCAKWTMKYILEHTLEEVGEKRGCDFSARSQLRINEVKINKIEINKMLEKYVISNH